MRSATCEGCGAVYKIPDSVTATRVRCKKCQGVVNVPAFESVEEFELEEVGSTPAPSHASESATPQSRRSREQGSRGEGRSSRRPKRKPDNHLVWAILTTVFCCLPFGVVAIVMAAQVDGAWNSGDHKRAQSLSNKAKTWAMWATVSGVVILVLYAIIFANV